MFSSRRNRQSGISGGIWFNVVGTGDRFPELFDRVLAFRFNLTHLAEMVVIVRERVIDARDVEVEAVSDRLGVPPRSSTSAYTCRTLIRRPTIWGSSMRSCATRRVVRSATFTETLLYPKSVPRYLSVGRNVPNADLVGVSGAPRNRATQARKDNSFDSRTSARRARYVHHPGRQTRYWFVPSLLAVQGRENLPSNRTTWFDSARSV